MTEIFVGLAGSIPIGVIVTIISPWLLTRFSRLSSAWREERIRGLQKELADITLFRSEKSTNKLVAKIAQSMISIITGCTSVLFLIALEILLTMRFSQRSPTSFIAFNVGVRGLRIAMTCTQILLYFQLASTSALFVYPGKLIARVLDDRIYDKYKRRTERTIKKLGGSLTQQEASGPETKASVEIR